jgi:dTDP-L-rhamnose 4-epimerase
VNVASGEPRTVLDLATTMAEAFAARHGDPPRAPLVVGGGRPGDVRHVFASTARAERLLGFRARRSFADGIAGLVDDTARRPVASGAGGLR